MIQCASVNGTDRVKATFTVLVDGHADPVAVVGDFNDWDPTATLLTRRGEQCMGSVVVDPGQRYAFRYLAEGGEWFNDEAADAYESNGLGAENSILDLSAPR